MNTTICRRYSPDAGAEVSRPAGRHVRYADETPMANLFVAMLDKMGVPVDGMGDSNGKFDYLSNL